MGGSTGFKQITIILHKSQTRTNVLNDTNVAKLSNFNSYHKYGKVFQHKYIYFFQKHLIQHG